jgi:hypothetical protein
MPGAERRYEKRRDALKSVDELFKHPAAVNVIHYSCESFYNRTDPTSPRITSIAVRHLESRQTTSFSIHHLAERHAVPIDRIPERYDELEREMLDDFYGYVRIHGSYRWVHWNMLDSTYGFPALAHRYRVLGGDPPEIPETNLYDLSSRLIEIYGPKYVGQPRLEALLKLNGWSDRGFLPGADEATAFVNGEYVKLHQSTLKKVDVIQNILERTHEGTLKTDATWADQHGTSLAAAVDWATSSWLFKLLGSIGILVSLATNIGRLFS